MPHHTQTSLAAALGVSKAAVSAYLRRSDFPAPKKPPWNEKHVKAIEAWRWGFQDDRSGKGKPPAARAPKAETRRNGEAAATAELTPWMRVSAEELRRRHTYEQALITRVKRMQIAGKLVSRDLVESALRGLAKRLIAFVQGLEQSLPLAIAQAAGADPAAVEPVVTRMLDDGRRQLAEEEGIQLIGVAAAVKRLQVAAKRSGRGKKKRGRK